MGERIWEKFSVLIETSVAKNVAYCFSQLSDPNFRRVHLPNRGWYQCISQNLWPDETTSMSVILSITMVSATTNTFLMRQSKTQAQCIIHNPYALHYVLGKEMSIDRLIERLLISRCGPTIKGIDLSESLGLV